MLFADDIVLIDETKKGVNTKLERRDKSWSNKVSNKVGARHSTWRVTLAQMR